MGFLVVTFNMCKIHEFQNANQMHMLNWLQFFTNYGAISSVFLWEWIGDLFYFIFKRETLEAISYLYRTHEQEKQNSNSCF